jgi:hypothetical protein
MIGFFNFCVHFTLLHSIAIVGTIGVLLGRKIWQGSVRTTDIISFENIVAEGSARFVVEAITCVVGLKLILCDTATLGKIIISITSISLDVFVSTS